MAGLDPAIHVFVAAALFTSPGMTTLYDELLALTPLMAQ
jgi:hypothetical protein